MGNPCRRAERVGDREHSARYAAEQIRSGVFVEQCHDRNFSNPFQHRAVAEFGHVEQQSRLQPDDLSRVVERANTEDDASNRVHRNASRIHLHIARVLDVSSPANNPSGNGMRFYESPPFSKIGRDDSAICNH